MASERFNFNVSFSEPVNRPGDEPVLTGEDVWQGIAHGARHPDDMAEYVASCEILSGDKTRFRRKLIIGGGGAVHTGAGQAIEQDVILRHMLHGVDTIKVEAVTIDSGATTIFGMSQGTQELPNPDRPDLYFTGVYELWIDGVKEGTPEAEEVRIKYGNLARGATQDGVKTFRKWKVEGKLDKWAKLENRA
ncbi:hypothetical protein B9Z65_3933 [Elsinoe australis]|uniref:Uncharacterized protein n=1 Tax=Elsinoe australis TaxID=40998 RepID=A0A2P7Z1D2_9PEZI|nr:hypothetical protein B9Z65_3933 [Elsinoe australis]